MVTYHRTLVIFSKCGRDARKLLPEKIMVNSRVDIQYLTSKKIGNIHMLLFRIKFLVFACLGYACIQAQPSTEIRV